MAALGPRAAPAGAHGFNLIELRHVDPGRLSDLLDEETRAWDEHLHWDFRPSASLVLQHTASGGLDGLALIVDGEVAGYSYWVLEGRKALIGDLYVANRWRHDSAESYLFRGVATTLNLISGSAAVPVYRGGGPSLWRNAWITRVEAQMLMTSARAAEFAAFEPSIQVYPRQFMLASLDRAIMPRTSLLAADLRYERWSMRWLDDAASLIAATYAGHIDSEINDQYRSVDGAQRFVQNVVKFPGCGVFQHESSWIAFTPAGDAAGMVAATRLSHASGHIAQICVHPAWQSAGVGAELMRRALEGLHVSGMREASLTVTEANPRAIALYERFGFEAVHRFDALVWDSASF